MQAVAALLAGTVAVSGVSAASGDALPGETLYNVKRSTERAQLALAGNDLGKAQLYLEFARTRIEEASEVSGDDAAVASALYDAAGELRSGTALLGELAVANEDPSPLDFVDLFTNEHRWVLEDLVSGLDGEALTAGEELVGVLEDAAVRSVELRGALDCTEPGGETDALGPIPGTCVKDAVDGTSPVDPGGTDGTESGVGETGSGETGEDSGGESEPATGESPAGETDAPASELPSGGASDPAQGDEPTETTGEDEVLDDLNGIISDLFD
jgi:hypothetical protein